MKLLLSKRAITRSSDSSVDKTKTVIAIKIGNINGVNIVGFSNLPSYVSSHASFALSNNFINLISDFYDNEKKSFNLNLEDEILQSATVVSAGKILKKEFD